MQDSNEWHSFSIRFHCLCCTSVCHTHTQEGSQRIRIRIPAGWNLDEKKTGQRKKHQEPSMLSNWVDAPLEIHKAFSLKIIKMRQAFKIKQRGNLIVLKRREKGSPVPHYFPHFLASYRWEWIGSIWQLGQQMSSFLYFFSYLLSQLTEPGMNKANMEPESDKCNWSEINRRKGVAEITKDTDTVS